MQSVSEDAGQRRKRDLVKSAIGSAAVFIGVACTCISCHLSRQGVVIRITAAEIQDRLDKVFPLTETYLMLFDLTLADPVVRFTEGSDRIGFGVSAVTNVRVNGENVGGRAYVTSGLAYDPEKRALFLADIGVDSLDMPLLPERYRDNVLLTANLAAQKYLKSYEVYRLDRSDYKQRLAGMLLRDVVVRDGALDAVFGPGR
jgi:hypothetical protein